MISSPPFLGEANEEEVFLSLYVRNGFEVERRGCPGPIQVRECIHHQHSKFYVQGWLEAVVEGLPSQSKTTKAVTKVELSP